MSSRGPAFCLACGRNVGSKTDGILSPCAYCSGYKINKNLKNTPTPTGITKYSWYIIDESFQSGEYDRVEGVEHSPKLGTLE